MSAQFWRCMATIGAGPLAPSQLTVISQRVVPLTADGNFPEGGLNPGEGWEPPNVQQPQGMFDFKAMNES